MRHAGMTRGTVPSRLVELVRAHVLDAVAATIGRSVAAGRVALVRADTRQERLVVQSASCTEKRDPLFVRTTGDGTNPSVEQATVTFGLSGGAQMRRRNDRSRNRRDRVDPCRRWLVGKLDE